MYFSDSSTVTIEDSVLDGTESSFFSQITAKESDITLTNFDVLNSKIFNEEKKLSVIKLEDGQASLTNVNIEGC